MPLPTSSTKWVSVDTNSEQHPIFDELDDVWLAVALRFLADQLHGARDDEEL